MKTDHLEHTHGGRIVSLDEIRHSTHAGIADWYFVGHVVWADGTESTAASIAPHNICTDQAHEPAATECRAAFALLNRYLHDAGTWHDAKHHRDGRTSFWTPSRPDGRRSI